MIQVECGHTSDPSLDEVARGLAQRFRGVVADRPITLGGTRALRVIAKNDGQTLEPVAGLAALHDGLLYLVMGAVTAGHSVEDELEAIRASWTWIPIESPHKHLEFRHDPLGFRNGAATINVPALMHVYPTENPDRVIDLGLHNVHRNEPDFGAYAQIVPMDEGGSLDEFKNRLSDGMHAKHVVKGAIQWRALGDNAARLVSEAIEVETTDEASGRKLTVLIIWALVKLDDRRVILVNFTLPPEEPRGRSTYIKLVDRIVESIKPAGGRGP
jgi:hypothetical protein